MPEHRLHLGGPPARRIHLETYGCTTNLGDTRTMAGLLAADGHDLVDTPDDADLIVVNTCTVIDTTDERIGHRLRTLRAAGKDLIVTGCLAAAQPERVARDAPEAPLLPPRQLHQIADLVGGRPLSDRQGDVRPHRPLPRTLGPADAIVPIAEGCIFSCNYCLTKTARGDQDSHPIHVLVQEVRDAVNGGAVEIKLTSQDTSGYGYDGGARLPELVSRSTDIGGDFRIRIGMMHPRTAYGVLPELLEAMDHDKVYAFLHLPIQTGSDAMLQRMNRGHTMEHFWAVVDAFRTRFPHGTVSTDIIVGHPGETDRDHQDTVELLHRLRAEHVNITRFSSRPGTASRAMDGRVETHVAKARSRELTELCLDMWASMRGRLVGQEIDVVVAEPAKKPGSMLGRGPGYEPVGLPGQEERIPLGSRVRVRVVQAHPTYLIGRPIEAPIDMRKAPRNDVVGVPLMVV